MAIDQDITNLPTPPSRSDSPSDFSDKADTFLAALPQLQTELNLYADEANTTQTAINTSETNAATSETNAENWASKIDGIVLSTDFSAKAYAIGGTGVTDVVGAAKEWAIKTGSTVDGADFSAKKYAQDSSNFADAAAATVNATEWQSGTTYDEFDAVIGSDGNTYRSLTNSNLGNDPVSGDGSNWLQLTAATPDLVLKPEPVEPADGATDIGETPTLDGGSYYSLYGKTHAVSRFQVSDAADFSNIVYDSGEISATTTHTVVGGNLQTSTEYYWRVYYEDEDGVESDWSDAFSFTTVDEFFAFNESFIGTQTEGGFYAGNVFSDVDGYLKAVIVSDGDGDTDRTGAGQRNWRNSDTNLPEAETLSDGKSVMDHIVANETLSNFPAFEWVQNNLNAGSGLNGHTDWYLPARDELELIYRNFKPTTQDNSDGTRETSGFGGDGATFGTNNSSDPTGSGYTTTDPSQTSISSFQDGGADYLSATGYWSSTISDIFGTTAGWVHFFASGVQDYRSYDSNYHVRAVRNVTVETPYNPSNIGMEMDGGFYAGNVRSDVDGNWYALIVSDAGGDTDRTGAGDKQWRTTQTELAEAQTLSDGKSVMDHIVANETLSDFPAFEWVQTTLNDANYNGYSDWYIPARDELELLYRHFKATTETNTTISRPTGEFGGDGATCGTNLFTAPADYDGYTTSDPSQTSITSFQDGGADYLTDGLYWASTGNDFSDSWVQRFRDGRQLTDAMINPNRVRAVRRVAI